jgi:hypothetical protein
MDQSPSRILTFSQASLQDYLDCPRRFELSSLLDAPWPAANSTSLTSFESLTELGIRFHQLCQQFFLGLEPEVITSSIQDQELLGLWNSFLQHATDLKALPYFSEQTLRVPFNNHTLVAKFDLILKLSNNEFLIIDWKTTRKKPSRSVLANRVQTYLYPFIFSQAGSDLFLDTPLLPESIKLQYWFPYASSPEEVFPYSQDRHDEVTQTLSDLIDDIDNKIQSSSQFELTDDKENCSYCSFRSYCDRDLGPKPLPDILDIENKDLSNTHFDLNLISEVEF